MGKEDIRETLEQYIIENQDRFYRLAYSHVGGKEEALDIVQEAIVKGLENCWSIRKPEYMKTWFFRVLLNECYGYARKSKREISYEPETLQKMQECGGSADPDSTDIYEAVLKLPDKLKTVIVLRFYEDFSLQEIAAATGNGLSAVKYRLYTGLNRLKKIYGEETR